ncbi:hypothetical protein CANCADRAFT_2569 [Tortispora caseinolytica NRRL Y-17796]|uniref:Cullin family profile domain-containing protein n=1 Tax=Tortispora caseinolytica NRRL Y-17796 TaxID=767744 RepID=A0A1E4TGL3_9ASCO|nr:hypothetical protein CANCADRAFT_2569 [Tortispora caseinolytica NRRL Y-17796]
MANATRVHLTNSNNNINDEVVKYVDESIALVVQAVQTPHDCMGGIASFRVLQRLEDICRLGYYQLLWERIEPVITHAIRELFKELEDSVPVEDDKVSFNRAVIHYYDFCTSTRNMLSYLNGFDMKHIAYFSDSEWLDVHLASQFQLIPEDKKSHLYDCINECILDFSKSIATSTANDPRSINFPGRLFYACIEVYVRHFQNIDSNYFFSDAIVQVATTIIEAPGPAGSFLDRLREVSAYFERIERIILPLYISSLFAEYDRALKTIETYLEGILHQIRKEKENTAKSAFNDSIMVYWKNILENGYNSGDIVVIRDVSDSLTRTSLICPDWKHIFLIPLERRITRMLTEKYAAENNLTPSELIFELCECISNMYDVYEATGSTDSEDINNSPINISELLRTGNKGLIVKGLSEYLEQQSLFFNTSETPNQKKSRHINAAKLSAYLSRSAVPESRLLEHDEGWVVFRTVLDHVKCYEDFVEYFTQRILRYALNQSLNTENIDAIVRYLANVVGNEDIFLMRSIVKSYKESFSLNQRVSLNEPISSTKFSTSLFKYDDYVALSNVYDIKEYQNVVVPETISNYTNAVLSNFQQHEKHKYLVYDYGATRCVLSYYQGENEYELVVTGFQALIILQFTSTEENTTLSVTALQENTGIPMDVLRRNLRSLTSKEHPLLLRTTGTDEQNQISHELFQLHSSWTPNKSRIVFSIPSRSSAEVARMKDSDADNNLGDRKMEIEATIARTLKGAQEFEHNDLVDTVQRLLPKGPVDVAIIKMAIDSLLERGFIERKETNIYRYR